MYNHIAMLSIYDVSTAPGGKVRFKDILKHFEDRLYLHPVFRRKLVNVPFGLDRPYWVAGSDIDIEFHIRHMALPAPGDWRQLTIQVARLHSRPLDHSRPLWEVYVIEGLDNIPNLPPGAFAVFLKIHHSVVDGMAAVHLIEQLHADTAAIRGATPQRSMVMDREPTDREMAVRGLSNFTRRVRQVASLSLNLGQHAIAAGAETLRRIASERTLPDLGLNTEVVKVPRTRFSERVSGHRVLEGFGMPFSRIKRVREKVPGMTLNDVFIAVAGGAVRRYLEAKNELPAQTLRALMPISLRTDASTGGNEVAGVSVPVGSDIADPIERLKVAHEGARISKGKAEAMGLEMFKNVVEVLPPAAVNFVADKFMLPSINMTVSNVRGPDKAMHLAGAKAMCLYPVSIPGNGAGLNITGVSYNRVMWVSVVSCRKMLPDPFFFIECMRGAWQELLAAADALPAVESAPKAPARRRKAAPRTAKASVAQS